MWVAIAIARPACRFVKAPHRRLSAFARRLDPLFGYADGPAPAFRLGQPALEHFPVTSWAQIASRVHRMATMRQLLGCDSMGYAPLREAVAEYLNASRGVRCDASQVAIVSGTLEALNLAARLQSKAEPGQILMDAETFSRVSGLVAATAMPPLTIKGLSAPVTVYAMSSRDTTR